MFRDGTRMFARAIAGWCVLLAGLAACVVAIPSAQASTAIAAGDLLAGESTGNVNHYASNGTLLGSISAGTNWETGACQDGSGHIYQTNFGDGTITRIASDGTVDASTWASGLSSPESCVVAPNGNVLVGQAGGDVVALDSSGSVAATYPVGGSDWISLANDNCTLSVAVEEGPITQYNICANSSAGSLTTSSGEAYQNEQMSNGDLLVAAGADVEEVNASGVVHTYTVPGSSLLFSLAIAADGNSFWVGDLYSGQISRISMSTGDVLQTLTQSGAGGLLVYGQGGTAGGYVAMGDSYSAGEGLAPYLDNSGCDRSSQAYGPELDSALALGTLTFAACTGAVTQDFFTTNHNHPSEPAQISDLKATTTSVTFTIGGNDVGFANVLDKCIHGVTLFHWKGYGCSKDKTLVSQVNSRIAALHGSGTATTPDGTSVIPIQTLLLRIHQLAPQAEIAVAGYAALFGSSSSTYTKSKSAPSKYVCQVGSGGSIDYRDAQWLNSEQVSLDNSISSAVATAQSKGVPVRYVDAVPTDFATHGLCDSGTAWVNGLSLSGLGAWPGSFHPTATGQSSGYESAFSGLPSF